MHKLIERYVYDVTRRLPQAERVDVERELLSSIADMLPDDPGEELIRKALTKLGSPGKLADQYRQKPRYLISPAMYDIYVNTLKWTLPIVGVICLVIGLFSGLMESVGANLDPSGIWTSMLSDGFSMGFGGALNALAWITVGFAIADRTDAGAAARGDKWSVDDLPREVPSEKVRIPLSDGIGDLIATALFAALGILVCAGMIPVVISLSKYGAKAVYLFNDVFLRACIPAILVSAVFGTIKAIVKIAYRRWCVPVCAAVLAGELISFGATLYVLSLPEKLTQAFSELARTFSAGPVGMDASLLLQEGLTNPIILTIAGLAALGTFISCAVAVFKTLRAHRA